MFCVKMKVLMLKFQKLVYMSSVKMCKNRQDLVIIMTRGTRRYQQRLLNTFRSSPGMGLNRIASDTSKRRSFVI